MVINSKKFPGMGSDIPEAFLRSIDDLSFSGAVDEAGVSHLPFAWKLLEKIQELQKENIQLNAHIDQLDRGEGTWIPL